MLFQESQLISTTATETYPTYSSATTYTLGSVVVYNTRLYESLVSSNIGNQPDTSPTKWLNISPDNKHAMFDSEVNTQTVATSSLTVVISPGKIIDSLAILNIVGTSLDVQIKDGPSGPIIYSKTINLDGSLIADWYNYFFSEFDYLDTVVLTDIPPYSTSYITITLTGGSNVKIGSCVYGSIAEIGDTSLGVNFGIVDYSIKETNEFGNTTFVKRPFSKRMEPQVYVENSKLRIVNKILEEIRSTPTVWIGSEIPGYEPLIMFGFFRDYSIDISYPSFSMLSLSIEGLI